MFSRQLPRVASTSTSARWASTAVQKRVSKAKRSTAVKHTPKVMEKTPLPTPAASMSLKSDVAGARSASTSPSKSAPHPPNVSKVPGNPEPPTHATVEAFNIKIPAPEVIAESPVQVPFVPDHRGTSRLPAPPEPIVDAEQPKIVVVGGAGTHHGGGPSHNLLDVSETASRGDAAPESPVQHERSNGIFDDIAEDLHLPPVRELKANFWKLFS